MSFTIEERIIKRDDARSDFPATRRLREGRKCENVMPRCMDYINRIRQQGPAREANRTL